MSGEGPALDVPSVPGGVPDDLFPALPTGVRWGLERVEALLDELGDPHRAYPSLHVAGTNGKGSTAAYCASVLRASGRRVGLYTSPHLCRFAERILVDGRPLPDGRLAGLAGALREGFLRHGPSFFEAATVLAFHAFREEGVEVAVVEVGLGGRLDATNVLRPEVAVVTNVSMDHADYLGETLAEIAAEKAGVAKEGVPFLTTETDPEVADVLRREGAVRGSALDVVRAEPPHVLDGREGGVAFRIDTRTWGPLDLRTGMPGAHQALNAALAVRALDSLPETLRPTRDSVAEGVREARWPGRLQREETQDGPWLLDVAHNEAGAATLVRALDDGVGAPAPGGSAGGSRGPGAAGGAGGPVLLVGVLGDKAWHRMLPPLLGRASGAVLTTPASSPPERAWDPAAAAERLRGAGGGPAPATCPLEVEPDFERALRRARALAGGGLVVVTGSSYTVGDALRLLGRCPFRAEG